MGIKKGKTKDQGVKTSKICKRGVGIGVIRGFKPSCMGGGYK